MEEPKRSKILKEVSEIVDIIFKSSLFGIATIIIAEIMYYVIHALVNLTYGFFGK